MRKKAKKYEKKKIWKKYENKSKKNRIKGHKKRQEKKFKEKKIYIIKLFKSLKYNDYVIWSVYADHYCMSNTTALTNHYIHTAPG